MTTKELFCVCLFVLVLVVKSGDTKGLYSGVPCHMFYDCSGHLRIGENVNINSKMIAMEYVEEEAMCQSLCADMEGCVVYNWWTENATYPKGPYTCELFARCLPHYYAENPSHSPVYAGMFQLSFCCLKLIISSRTSSMWKSSSCVWRGRC